MIYVVEEKHLNDFKQCRCVKPKDLYSRLGNRQPNIDFSSSEEPIPMNQNKIDILENLMQDYDEFMSRQAGTDAESGGNNHSNDKSTDD